MAKENYVFISGQVCGRPKIFLNPEKEPYKAIFLVKTIRRHLLRSNFSSINNGANFDVVPITTFNTDCVNKCLTIRENDFVEIKGVYTTKEAKKKLYCACCSQLIEVEGITTFITPIYINLCERAKCEGFPDGFDTQQSISLLRDRAEISNVIKLIGRLCREPERIMNVKQASAQYQIAVNRKFKIREDSPDTKTDFPWIKSYGPQAEEDFNALHVNSLIYVDGCIQSRQIKRRLCCPHCGGENSFDDVAYEIVPYSVEYLADCALPDPQEDHRSDAAEA